MGNRILVVEDDTLLATAITEELTEAGYVVEKVRNGQDAEAKLNSSKFDLVFLDIMLAGDYSGFEVLEAIRAPQSPYKSIPVIMLSNMGEWENLKKATDMGATDFMVKATTDLSKIVASAQKYLPQ